MATTSGVGDTYNRIKNCEQKFDVHARNTHPVAYAKCSIDVTNQKRQVSFAAQLMDVSNKNGPTPLLKDPLEDHYVGNIRDQAMVKNRGLWIESADLTGVSAQKLPCKDDSKQGVASCSWKPQEKVDPDTCSKILRRTNQDPDRLTSGSYSRARA